MGYRPPPAVPQMCHDCPFGHTPAQVHMRTSLRPGRFEDICQSVLYGEIFICHKTMQTDDEGEWLPSAADRECAGAIAFLEALQPQRSLSRQELAELLKDVMSDIVNSDIEGEE